MKLFYSATSPFVRKVLACAITRKIDAQIARITTNPHDSPPALLAANPLSKVPCLVTEDGLALFDSPLICEYLDSVGEEPAMFPRAGSAESWHALKQQALGDGMLDAAVLRRGEMAKPQEAARDAVMQRQQAVVARSLDLLEREVPHTLPDIGSLTLACALGYLDFRFGHEPWRVNHPRLAAWYEEMAALPGLAESRPA